MLARPWLSMMKQTVVVAPNTGNDQRGNPTYSTSPTTYRCRVVGKRKQVVDQNGRAVISSQTVYLASGDNVLPDAKVTLSTQDVGSTESWAINPPIIATGRFPDERGFLYTALHLR